MIVGIVVIKRKKRLVIMFKLRKIMNKKNKKFKKLHQLNLW